MKKIILPCMAIMLSASTFYFTTNQTQYNIQENISGEKEEIEGALEFQFLRTQNPYTGEVPHGNVMEAFTNLKARGFFVQGESRDVYGWQNVNDYFPSLAVTKITYDPNSTNIFYFCTGEGWFNADAQKGAGVFKSSDFGATWNQLTATNNANYVYCQDIAVHPLTSDVYVATKTGLYRSADAGENFQKVLGSGAGAVKNSICDIEFTSDGGVFVSIGIFETDGIYYSPSGDSATYVKQTGGFPSSGIFRIELATAPSNADVCYAIPCSTSQYKIAGIYKTIDRGTNWDTVSLPGNDYELAAKQAWYDLSLAVDPNNENIVVAGGLHVWRSKDGGISWQQLTTGRLDSLLVRYMHVDQHEVVFQTSEIVYFANDGGIYKCDNFSSENPVIYPVNSNYNVTQFYAASMHPDASHPGIIGGTQDNGSLMAVNFGLTDFKTVSGQDGAFCAYHPAEGNKFYTTTQYEKIFRYNNGGFEIPDTISNPNVTEDNLLFINPIEISTFNPDVLFQASNIGLWRLKNASVADTSEWEKASATGGSITALASGNATEDYLFFGKSSSNGEIYMVPNATTADGSLPPVGLDPSDMLPDASFLGSLYCSGIFADVNDANHIMLCYANYGVESIWQSSNALSGLPAWENVEGDLPDIPVYSVVIHPVNADVAYAATELGIFYTNDLNGSSTQWLPCSGSPVVRTDQLRIRASDKKIIAATHGRGIWEAILDEDGTDNDIVWIERGPNNIGGRTRTILVDPNVESGKQVWAGSVGGGLWKTTDIDAVSIQQHDDEPIVTQIFPNPADEFVSLHIQNTTGRKYTVEVFDISGKKIQTLTENNFLTYLQFNVSNYSAGIYFVTITSGRSKKVLKLAVN